MKKTPEAALALHKTLNEQSVDAAHVDAEKNFQRNAKYRHSYLVASQNQPNRRNK